MLKIHLLYEHDTHGNPHGCSHIRLLRPFGHPSIANECRTTSGTSLTDITPDVVIVERLWRPDISLTLAAQLVTTLRQKGIKFLYTLDDNLVDLHLDQPWKQSVTDNQRMVVRYFIREADGVIVSTENLRTRFLPLNNNIIVVPNALDERLFSAPKVHNVAPSERVTIGYMGTFTHSADLMMILQPLREVMRRNNDNVFFQLVGVTQNTRILDCFDGFSVEILNLDGCYEYPSFIKWAQENIKWDIGLAPLEANVFNKYKSDIKFLDYSMLAIPTVCSNVDAYMQTVKHMETGWTCCNDVESWFTALARLVEDNALRNTLAAKAHDYVLSKRTLRHCAINWLEAIDHLVQV